jgi:tRNA pseudouridine55 synthase
VDGVILYDKPAGITSHDAVYRVRRMVGRGVKVGHAGTLDPFATGLLLVLVGRAARVQRFLMELPKTYVVVARFGAVSSTGDRDGVVTETGVVPVGDLALPVGRLMQVPPAYSAIQVGGRRAYSLARAGVEVALEPREVAVHAFVERSRDADRREYEIVCGSGTYVRSLIADLGDAYCEELRRTRIGSFAVADADPARVVPLSEALAFIPAVALSGEDARRAAHGAAVSADVAGASAASGAPGASGPSGHELVRLTDDDGLIALARPDDEGRLRVVVGFRG